jgi:hypothetical protein
MNRLTCATLALALLVLSAGVASAAIISDSDVFGPAQVASAPTNVALDKFDPALGTLTKVTLNLSANTTNGTIDWDNEAGVPSDIDLGIGAEVTATAPSALTVVVVPLQTDSGNVTADTDGVIPDFVGTDAFSVTGGAGSDSDSTSSVAPAVLAAYTATFLGETFNVNISSLIETFVSTTGGFGPTQFNLGDFDGTVEVIYEYNPVPEPGSVMLAAMAACGAGLAVRRRRK